ncbi:Carbohydrate Sulfotransferase 5 [Manis pentadactyla]|nr:Carbohydrate Sulfotransferase 5 [Manis pentadactyla]
MTPRSRHGPQFPCASPTQGRDKAQRLSDLSRVRLAVSFSLDNYTVRILTPNMEAPWHRKTAGDDGQKMKVGKAQMKKQSSRAQGFANDPALVSCTSGQVAFCTARRLPADPGICSLAGDVRTSGEKSQETKRGALDVSTTLS